jgi:hypothetical protein
MVGVVVGVVKLKNFFISKYCDENLHICMSA